MPGQSSKWRWVLLAGCCAASVFNAGCYRRTVYAQGMGAKHMTVQKSYRSETALDRWWDSEVMGNKPRKRRPGGTVSTVAPAPSAAASKSWTVPPEGP